MSTKMAKASTVQSDSCHYCQQLQQINFTNVFSRLYITIFVLKNKLACFKAEKQTNVQSKTG
jgi:hypothetical protein